jgi:serine/threonine protein kinase
MIARGGMAEVYLGEHTTLNRKVAVKIMRDHVDSDPELRGRFDREARVVAGLRHPNIIQVHDFDLADGQPYLVMEHIPGATLGSYLKALHNRREQLPFQIVSRILTLLASAIDYAHSNQIIHRDIKPANILLRSASGPIDPLKPLPQDVEPILTDFGLVRLVDSSFHTSTGTVSGTPAYMSPEQARGEKVDKRTDIYSFGVILYEMIAGTVPFDAESTVGILMKLMNEPPPAIPGISSDMQNVIDRALSKVPQFRYETAGQLAAEFVGVFNGQTVSMNTQKLAVQTRKAVLDPARQNRILGLDRGLISVGLVILLGAVYFGLRYFSIDRAKSLRAGQVVFSDFNAFLDRATISISDLPVPEPGTHYEAWALAQGGEVRRNIGRINMDGSAIGQLTYIDPQQASIISQFDQIEITIEPDNDPNPDRSSEQIVASSVFPPLALIHIRHVTSSFGGSPNGTALIQGLWNDADRLQILIQEAQSAFRGGDEDLFRLKIEESINLIAGQENTEQYKDWNLDGTVNDPGDGYGLLGGYIPSTISHAQFAAEALDSTQAIQSNSALTVIAVQNVEGWTRQVLEKSIQLQQLPMTSEMEPLISEMIVLSEQIVSGTDSNNNQIIEPVVGEGGADTAYEYAYNLTIMPLLPGAHQLPPPAPNIGN